MLTKEDLEAIDKLLDKKLDNKLLPFEDRFTDLEDKISELNDSILSLRMDFKEETQSLGRRIRELKKRFDDQFKFLVKEHNETRKRVRTLESHLKISQA